MQQSVRPTVAPPVASARGSTAESHPAGCGQGPQRSAPAKQTARKADQPTIFLARLYEMVNDAKTDKAIQWTTAVSASPEPGPSAFTILDNMLLEKHWLPKYYKHANFTSFVRQLNQYQFRKLEPKRWTFGHTSFVKQRPELLVNISRKRKECARSSKQKSSKKMAIGVASSGADARPQKLEAFVKQLSETLHRVVQQQVEIQTQINDLRQRIGSRGTGDESHTRKQAAEEHPVTTAVGLPSSPPWTAQASMVEFADIDIPTTDIDAILSPPNPLDDGQQQDANASDLAEQIPQKEEQREHPLQLPRPSTLFQVGY